MHAREKSCGFFPESGRIRRKVAWVLKYKLFCCKCLIREHCCARGSRSRCRGVRDGVDRVVQRILDGLETYNRQANHSFLSSFSAGSTATIATKYSFFQVFRDLQIYLAKFCKLLQKISDFRKNQHFFAKIRKFRKNFAKFCDFF